MKNYRRVLLGVVLRMKKVKMHFRWLYIFSVVFVLTSWFHGESTTASDLKAVDEQSQNGLNSAMNDSVDVEKIVFYSERDGNSEIYMINTDGTGEVRLTVNNFEDISPDLSPDGVHIIFISNRDGNREIYKMKTDGTDVIRLTNTTAEEVYPFWSADNSKIIFSSKRDGSNYEIYMMNPDGTGQTRITNTVVSEEWPYLSPDMSKIVYGAGNFPDFKVYRCNVDGSDVQEIAQGAIPKWSRDGNKIAHNKLTFINEIFEGDFYIINADGTEPRKITNSPQGTVSENPYWSPDGTRFAFQSNLTGNFQIYVIDTTGNNQTRITNHTGNDYWPSWGVVRVPLKKYLGQTPPGTTPQVFAWGIISTDETQEFASTFSPDGKEFYFTRRPTYDNSEQQRIWYTKVENGEWTEPALAPFTYDCFEAEPYISPDGMRLYYASSRPLPGNDSLNQMPAIWLLNKTANGWSDPEYVGEKMMYVSEANNRSLYYTALEAGGDIAVEKRSRIGWGYIAVKKWNGTGYETPERLSDSVNCLVNTAHPFIAPDESYILYDGSVDGIDFPDIYVSYKKNDGSWTKGVKLGNNVNTDSHEICSSVSPDGKYLFFESGRAGTMDIYWVDAEVLCIKGNADNSGSIDISDVIYLINYLFKGGPAPEPMFAGDCNNDNNVSVSDVVYLINYLLKGGPKPSCL